MEHWVNSDGARKTNGLNRIPKFSGLRQCGKTGGEAEKTAEWKSTTGAVGQWHTTLPL
jgi:hypothetical protein